MYYLFKTIDNPILALLLSLETVKVFYQCLGKLNCEITGSVKTHFTCFVAIKNKLIRPTSTFQTVANYVGFNDYHGFTASDYVIPRSIKLVTELSYIEEGLSNQLLPTEFLNKDLIYNRITDHESEYAAMCTILALDDRLNALINTDDPLRYWQASIIPATGGRAGYVGDRLYSL